MNQSDYGVRRIFFAGGGTAGHVQPALAVAQAWRESYPADEISFIGTRIGLENQLVPAAGFSLHHIPKVIIPRKLSSSILVAPTTLTTAFLQSRFILREADLLIGFGGFVSAPAYLAARSLRIPMVIHEANAKPGLANRLGALFSPYLAVAQRVYQGRLSKALVTGLPLRPDVSAAFLKSSPDWLTARTRAKQKLGMKTELPVIAIFFGSQGSVSLNAVIAQSLSRMLATGAQVYHAVGKNNPLPAAREGYQPIHYIEDMATAYLAADLIICRSGAVTCSEVNALGKYSLFIPLPIGNGEQRINARELISQSRGEVLDQKDFTQSWLDMQIVPLLRKAAAAAPEGSGSDLKATDKIVALMELALNDSENK